MAGEGEGKAKRWLRVPTMAAFPNQLGKMARRPFVKSSKSHPKARIAMKITSNRHALTANQRGNYLSSPTTTINSESFRHVLPSSCPHFDFPRKSAQFRETRIKFYRETCKNNNIYLFLAH